VVEKCCEEQLEKELLTGIIFSAEKFMISLLLEPQLVFPLLLSCILRSYWFIVLFPFVVIGCYKTLLSYITLCSLH